MTASAPGVFIRVVHRLRQFVCGLHGHDTLLHFEQSRMSLQCVSCGYESPGWDVKRAPVVREAAAQAPRRRTVRIPLIGERRAA